MATTINPRFPHFCTIRRITQVDSFMPDDPFSPDNLDEEGFPVKDTAEEVVYSGPCRRESSTNIRTFTKGNSTVGQLVYGDFRLSMPGKIPLRKGDIIDVDYIIGQDKGATLLHPSFSSLKTRDCPQGSTECYYSLADI